jgi:hypothetical protein
MLFYGGLIGSGLLLAAGLVSTVVFCLTGRRLRKQLEMEYGKRRHK